MILNESLNIIIAIVDRGKGKYVSEIYSKNKVLYSIVARGNGTANSEIMDYLGLDEPKKEVVCGLCAKSMVSVIFSELESELDFAKPGTGIAFSIPLDSLCNISDKTRNLCEQENESKSTSILNLKENRISMENTEKYVLIVSVVEEESSDIVMKYAKAAGCRGGTVIRAKDTTDDHSHSLFGMSLDPEKEIVLILAPNSAKANIIKAISEGYIEETDVHPVVFSIPVNDATLTKQQ